jgi:hypothetical protein
MRLGPASNASGSRRLASLSKQDARQRSGREACRCCRLALLETDWQRRNHAKIRRVASDADTEHHAFPRKCVEPHVNAAQQPVRVGHDEVNRMRIGEIGNVEAGAYGCRGADSKRGPHSAPYNIRIASDLAGCWKLARRILRRVRHASG